ncbi:hypothetical protein ACIBKX_33905 [Streptomyces sp. NPDC050658]|uniref:hypothetical protein n=1 Tax=unclassified Streptomyces TaxID=2593676 RepID=UPI003417BCCB
MLRGFRHHAYGLKEIPLRPELEAEYWRLLVAGKGSVEAGTAARDVGIIGIRTARKASVITAATAMIYQTLADM